MGRLNKEGSGWTKLILSEKQENYQPKTRFYQIIKSQIEAADQSLGAIGGLRSRTVNVENEAELNKKVTDEGCVYLMRKNKTYDLITPEQLVGELVELTKEPYEVVKTELDEADIANENEPAISSESEEKQNDLDTIVSNKLRLASVDKHEPNTKLTKDSFDELVGVGGGLCLSRENPFRAAFVDGQIKWTSISDGVSAKDVEEIIEKTTKINRRLHVNTGTHGDPEGKTVRHNKSYAEAEFAKQDLDIAWNLNNVSIHIMSQGADALTHDKYPNIDIIDAWCFSKKSQCITKLTDEDIESKKGPIELLCEKLLCEDANPSSVISNSQQTSSTGLMSGSTSNFFGNANNSGNTKNKNNNYGVQQLGHGSSIRPSGDMNFGLPSTRSSSAVTRSSSATTKRSIDKVDPTPSGEGEVNRHTQKKTIVSDSQQKAVSDLQLQELVYTIVYSSTKDNAKRLFSQLEVQAKARIIRVTNYLRTNKQEEINDFVSNWNKPKWRNEINLLIAQLDSDSSSQAKPGLK